jgi:glycosyltransferase involved in cell wall biosynthesis
MQNKYCHIAIFTTNLDKGGVQKVVISLVKGFIDRKIKTDIVLLNAKGIYLSKIPDQVRIFDLEARPNLFPYRSFEILNFLTKRKLKSPLLDFLWKCNLILWKIAHYIHNKRINRIFWINDCALKLADYLRSERPCALLSLIVDPNLISVRAKYYTRIPMRLVISERASIMRFLVWNELTRIPLIKRDYPKADKIIVVSHELANEMHQVLSIPHEKFVVIYNPISPELFQKMNEPINHSWFENEQPPVILAVGRLTKQKDFPNLLRAFAIVRQYRPARLLILGDGEDRPLLEQLAKDLNISEDVSLPGFTDNPYAFMKKSAIFVLSSIYEGLPNVLLEALACGCPVVATDCPTGPREILDNGRYGRLVPVGDHEALAKAILETLDNPDFPATKEERIQRALEFSLDAAVEKYLQVLLPERFGNTSRRQENL